MIYTRNESDGLSTVDVSTGLQDNIEPVVLGTLQCDILLTCLSCTFPQSISSEIEQCEPSVVFTKVPDGDYTVNVTISSSCNEELEQYGTFITICETGITLFSKMLFTIKLQEMAKGLLKHSLLPGW